MAAAPFAISIRLVDGVRVVSVVGELDLASAPVLVGHLETFGTSGAPPVVIDLAGVSFIDARGLRALIDAHRRCNRDDGPGLRLVRALPATRRLFDLTGTSGMLAD